MLNGVGGSIEACETPLQAMVREFREEAGMETLPEEWTETVVIYRPNAEIHVFISYGPIDCYSMTDEQMVVVELVSPHVNLIPDARWALLLSMDQGVVFPIEVSYTTQPWEQAPA